MGMRGNGYGALSAIPSQKHDNVIVAVVIVDTAILAAYVSISQVHIENSVALVVGVGISIIVAVMVYGGSRRSEAEIKQVVDEIHKILQVQEALKRERSEKATAKLIDALGGISAAAAQIDNYTARGTKTNAVQQATMSDVVDNIVSESQHLSEMMPTLLDHINPDDGELVASLCRLCESLAGTNVGGKALSGTCSTIKAMADKLIRSLDESRAAPGEASHAAAECDNGLSVVLDRTAYPLDAIVRVRTQADLPHGKEIKYTVTDEYAKSVHKSRIRLADPRHQESLREGRPVDQTIRLKGRKWKAGHQYTVTARQGSLSGTVGTHGP